MHLLKMRILFEILRALDSFPKVTPYESAAG